MFYPKVNKTVDKNSIHKFFIDYILNNFMLDKPNINLLIHLKNMMYCMAEHSNLTVNKKNPHNINIILKTNKFCNIKNIFDKFKFVCLCKNQICIKKHKNHLLHKFNLYFLKY